MVDGGAAGLQLITAGLPGRRVVTVERLEAYLQAIPQFPTVMKEFEWRNGWFDAISRRERAAGRPDPLPRHSAALRQLGL